MITAFALVFLMMTEKPAQGSPKVQWEYKTGG